MFRSTSKQQLYTKDPTYVLVKLELDTKRLIDLKTDRVTLTSPHEIHNEVATC